MGTIEFLAIRRRIISRQFAVYVQYLKKVVYTKLLIEIARWEDRIVGNVLYLHYDPKRPRSHNTMKTSQLNARRFSDLTWTHKLIHETKNTNGSIFKLYMYQAYYYYRPGHFST